MVLENVSNATSSDFSFRIGQVGGLAKAEEESQKMMQATTSTPKFEQGLLGSRQTGLEHAFGSPDHLVIEEDQVPVLWIPCSSKWSAEAHVWSDCFVGPQALLGKGVQSLQTRHESKTRTISDAIEIIPWKITTCSYVMEFYG